MQDTMFDYIPPQLQVIHDEYTETGHLIKNLGNHQASVIRQNADAALLTVDSVFRSPLQVDLNIQQRPYSCCTIMAPGFKGTANLQAGSTTDWLTLIDWRTPSAHFGVCLIPRTRQDPVTSSNFLYRGDEEWVHLSGHPRQAIDDIADLMVTCNVIILDYADVELTHFPDLNTFSTYAPTTPFFKRHFRR